ncbi:hypothetical protein DMN91_003403 [Ooceraea biroi]|uniref:Uncharacterized protein n=1 Tax=Ooceraea biroi TaxID=2015173 RepID=A0A3L8DRZ4_OOCBI|nr:hypothetical protein DMN91_003403 [Ooceraea biroi]
MRRRERKLQFASAGGGKERGRKEDNETWNSRNSIRRINFLEDPRGDPDFGDIETRYYRWRRSEKKLNEGNGRGETRKSSSRRQMPAREKGTGIKRIEMKKEKGKWGNVPGRGYTEAAGTLAAENQFDVGVDPYSRNVKYPLGWSPSEEQAIRVMAVLLVIFIFLPRADLALFSRDPVKLYGNVSRQAYEEPHLGSAEALRRAVKK